MNLIYVNLLSRNVFSKINSTFSLYYIYIWAFNGKSQIKCRKSFIYCIMQKIGLGL
jgi:hypothetical protein